MLDTATISTLGLLYMYIKSSMTRIRQDSNLFFLWSLDDNLDNKFCSLQLNFVFIIYHSTQKLDPLQG